LSKSIAVEGDFIETIRDNLIFDVKGLLHPKNKIICFLRYFPDHNGNRMRNNIKYSKIYELEQRFNFLRKNYPEFLFYSTHLNRELQGVNIKDIKQIFKPKNCYKNLKSASNLTPLQQKAIGLCNYLIDNSQLTDYDVGITGSIMVGLENENSDLDLIIYGTKVGLIIQNQLKELYQKKNSPIRKYNLKEFGNHFEFRAGGASISFEDFMRSERRKLHQGKYYDTDFFIRYIKSPEDWGGKFSNYIYNDCGRIKLKAEIIDSTNSIFTPCVYKIKPIKFLTILPSTKIVNLNQIYEITSYRGRFCEHAINGEKVCIEGKLEKITINKKMEYFHIVIGEKNQDKMIILHHH
jgi:predicted nucleotidyltransferase